jgi:hypothetical protein
MKNLLLITAAVFFIKICNAQSDSLYFRQIPPGIVPEVFAPGIVTGYVHGTVAISPKGDEIYWVVNPSATERIMYSKFENGIWTQPAVAEFVKDYLTLNNGGLTFSPDGEKLFFYSDRPGGKGNYDCWYVERTDSGWSKPINAGEPYNTADAELSPLFTNKGNAYCLRYNDNHETSPLSFKYSNGKFSDPVPMENIPEYGPWWTLYFSPEEDYLIFAGDADDADLYIRFKNNEGQWGNPTNLGNEINTAVGERFPVLSPDGKYLFFTRELNSSNVFWVSTAIIDSLRNAVTEIKVSQANEKMYVFPNPTTGRFTLSFGATPAQKSLVELHNAEGKLVLLKAFHNTATATIDLFGFSAGMYLVKVLADGVSYEEKFLKSNE